jgi:hypothetical protein
MKTHDCPYLQFNIYCTHKRPGTSPDHFYCGYNDLKDCKLLEDDKSVLLPKNNKEALESVETPKNTIPQENSQ